MLTVTRERLKEAGCCYPQGAVDALVPPEGLTPAQVARLDVPYHDRTWAIMRASGLSREGEVEFAIREVMRMEGLKSVWVAWALRWLDGSDRSLGAVRKAESLHIPDHPVRSSSDRASLRTLWAAEAVAGGAEEPGWNPDLPYQSAHYASMSESWAPHDPVAPTPGGPQLARLLDFCATAEARSP